MSEMRNFMSHLIELRKRLIKCLLVLTIIVLILLPFSQVLFQALANPLLNQLPKGQTLIATGLVSPIFIPIKLAMLVGLFLAMPYFIFQAWTFIAAGLYANEKRILWLLMILSCLLFYSGVILTYFLVFPLLFKYFLSFVPTGVSSMPDISQYLDFCLKLMFAFGLGFEIPVAVTILIYLGITPVQKLKEARPYVIVGAFILGMLLTPPDVLSQIMLAVPMCLLYECGMILGGYLVKKNKTHDDKKEFETT